MCFIAIKECKKYDGSELEVIKSSVVANGKYDTTNAIVTHAE